MFDLCKAMREAISQNRFPDFVKQFLRQQFHSALIDRISPPQSVGPVSSFSSTSSTRSPSPSISTVDGSVTPSTVASSVHHNLRELEEVSPCPPLWVKDALAAAGVDVSAMYDWDKKPLSECGDKNAAPSRDDLVSPPRKRMKKNERKPKLEENETDSHSETVCDER